MAMPPNLYSWGPPKLKKLKRKERKEEKENADFFPIAQFFYT